MSLEKSTDEVLAPGDPAPTFELPGADGAVHALGEFADASALLVVFTCNHCPYAKAKMPALNAIAADYDDVAVVGINSNDADGYPDDSLDRMTELVDDGTVAYDAYLHDESQEVAAAYGAVCTPDPFLFVNEDGTFHLVAHGRLDDALNPDDAPSREPGFEMRAAIDAALASQDVDELPPSQGCSIKWKPGNEPAYWD